MRKPAILAAAAVLALAAGTSGALVARAAPPPPPPGAPGGGPVWHHGPHHGAWGPHGGPGWGMMHHRPLITPGTFALLYHPKNRDITPADATAIATGFLRWNGNHSWKVTDVKAAGDGHIGFAYATPNGDVIARFTINTRTGRIRRVG